MPQVTFLTVKDNSTKLTRLLKLIDYLYKQEKIILIFAPNMEVAKYIDNLLWKSPETSFIPHEIANDRKRERVIITTSSDPIMGVDTLVNLSPKLHPNFQHFIEIFELFDKTSRQKEELSLEKKELYHTKKYLINDY